MATCAPTCEDQLVRRAVDKELLEESRVNLGETSQAAGLSKLHSTVIKTHRVVASEVVCGVEARSLKDAAQLTIKCACLLQACGCHLQVLRGQTEHARLRILQLLQLGLVQLLERINPQLVICRGRAINIPELVVCVWVNRDNFYPVCEKARDRLLVSGELGDGRMEETDVERRWCVCVVCTCKGTIYLG